MVKKDAFKFNDDFIKICNEESDEGYFLELDAQYLKKLHELHNDLPFLTEEKQIEKVGKVVASLHDKIEYVIQKRYLKQALNHGLVLQKVHRVIKFNENAWPKTHIDMHTYLRKKSKKWFWKRFF